MAFFGLLIANGLIYIAFMIWIGMVLLGAVSLILFIVFLRKYHKNKRKQIKKTWQKIVSILCLLTAVFNLGIAGSAAWSFTHPGPETIHIKTENGEEEVLKEDAFTLEHAIEYDDVEDVRKILEDTPAFWDYTSIGGSTIMGIAVANGSVEVAEYLLQNGFDVDKVGTSGKDTAFRLYTRQIIEDEYDPAMFRLLLKYQATTSETVVPILCDIIEAMCLDGILTDDEVELLDELVDAGLSRELTNGLDENAEEVFKRLIKEKEIDKNCPEQVGRGMEILRD